MIMKNNVLCYYCFISSEGTGLQNDFDYWICLCLQFN